VENRFTFEDFWTELFGEGVIVSADAEEILKDKGCSLDLRDLFRNFDFGGSIEGEGLKGVGDSSASFEPCLLKGLPLPIWNFLFW